MLLGVDYGTSRTGLAMGRSGTCSALQAIPSPRTCGLSDVARRVLEVALEQGAEGILVGIPVQPGGSIVKPHTDSWMGARCRNLAHTLALLANEHKLSVFLYNEASTTRAVINSMGYNWQHRLPNDERQARGVDAESAAMLLRLYYGDPRLAVRVKPKAIVVKRSPEDGPM
ncbi:hypothetical protein TSOC_008323 [Tetrabaena socialis]|uniref:Pre-16S rRNA nuclease n=1 Tax=Tetrabaena socialis TaxID=47790 RepID=A0A2J7ZYS4_9CHLO|nr:hypothetical protein TSOC_008323 [Tetrabaena socialis]|eukprot:PNH05417.1 hypothetical protein TSOC_008323 [Tetrabaena socialis]